MKWRGIVRMKKCIGRGLALLVSSVRTVASHKINKLRGDLNGGKFWIEQASSTQ